MCKLNVAIIYGGVSSEHEVSIISATTIMTNMSDAKYNKIPIYITKEGKWLAYEGPNTNNLAEIQWDNFGVTAVLSPDRNHKGVLRIVNGKVNVIPIDVIFPVLHGKNGEDGTIQGLFEISGIDYVGCGVMCSAVAMDKEMTKVIAKNLNIDQADYLYFNVNDIKDIDNVTKRIRYEIGYPCFIKPANEGSSVGISKATNKKEVIKGLKLASKYDEKIVIEKAIFGRELECAILGNTFGEIKVSGVGEIFTAGEFYDYDSKYHDENSKTVLNADIKEEISSKIKENAIMIFEALNGRGLSRVDFFLEDKTNRVIFNEINTLPGFTSISMYPMLWKEQGLKIPDLVDKLISLARE